MKNCIAFGMEHLEKIAEQFSAPVALQIANEILKHNGYEGSITIEAWGYEKESPKEKVDKKRPPALRVWITMIFRVSLVGEPGKYYTSLTTIFETAKTFNTIVDSLTGREIRLIKTAYDQGHQDHSDEMAV